LETRKQRGCWRGAGREPELVDVRTMIAAVRRAGERVDIVEPHLRGDVPGVRQVDRLVDELRLWLDQPAANEVERI
jgi:hypothetical protein